MSGNGCSCAGSPAPAGVSAPMASPASAATPCGSGAQFTETVWQTLALGANATQVSRAIPTRGANAVEIIITTIGGAGAIQTVFQAQMTNDGVNYTNIGAAGQSTAVGYVAMSAITGNGAVAIRLVATEQLGNLTLFTIIARFYCG